MRGKGVAVNDRILFAGLLVGVVVALGMVSCGAGGETGDDEGDEKPVIRLAGNPWQGSRLDAAVAAILLKEEMGYPVEVIPIDEYAQFPAMANGDIHASLEVWPSGHEAHLEQYVRQDGTVADGGNLGVIGKIGWFLPSYMLDYGYPLYSS